MGRGGRDGAGRGSLAVQGGGLLVVRGDDLDRGGRGAGRGQPALPGCSGRGRGPGDMMIDWVSPLAGIRPLSLIRPSAWPGVTGPAAADRRLAGAGRGGFPIG